MKDKHVYLLDDARIDFYWEPIVELFKSVPGFFDFYTSEWLYHGAKMGHLQLWAASDSKIRAIVMTQILVFPATKVFEVTAGGGVGLLDFLSEMEATFEWIARDAECEYMVSRVRPGLERKLRKFASTKIASVLTRKLEPNLRTN